MSDAMAAAAVFSSFVGRVDGGLEQRASLLAALKERLKTSEAPEPPAQDVIVIDAEQPASSSRNVHMLRNLGADASRLTPGSQIGLSAPLVPELPGYAPDASRAPSSSLITALKEQLKTSQPAPSPAEPPAKRPRSEGSPGLPLPLQAPMQDAADAEQAALAARKAQMLKSLGADASKLQQGSQTAPSAPPSVPEPPPGASPEEFEAYRQQCWRQYYQYCSVWQKYYDQSKGGKAQATHAKGMGKGKWPQGAPGAQGAQGAHAHIPQAPPVQRSSPEDDIHSQLLGL